MQKPTTQSFSHGKAPRPSVRSKATDYSPERSQGGQSYFQTDNQRFKRLNLDKEFDPREYITGQLAYEDIIDLKQVFDIYDSTARMVWVPNDLMLYLQQNGFNVKSNTAYSILQELDPEQTGLITFKNFVKAMGTKPNHNPKQTDKLIVTMFKKYDLKGKGYIDITDLKNLNKRLNEDIEEETLGLMLSRADSDNDGKITLQDFKTIMARPYKWNSTAQK